jgi:hypothetical protein
MKKILEVPKGLIRLYKDDRSRNGARDNLARLGWGYFVNFRNDDKKNPCGLSCGRKEG